LRAEKYDAVIDAQGLIKSAVLVTKQANGVKYGYDKYSAREGLSSWFYDKTFNISYQQHAVARIRQLFAKALDYTLPEEIGDYGITQHFAKNRENSTAYVVMIHATTRADKHWPETHWADLIRSTTALGLRVHLPWGNEQEKARAERLAKFEAIEAEFQKEMDIINKVFIELMIAGDAAGRGFQYPIPTYNITKDFDCRKCSRNFECKNLYWTR